MNHAAQIGLPMPHVLALAVPPADAITEA